jgi:hypothetical protein
MGAPSGFATATFCHALPPPAVAAALPALVTTFHRASERADLLRYAVAVSQKPSPVVSKGLDRGALERLGSVFRDGQLLSVDLCERAPLPRKPLGGWRKSHAPNSEVT